MSLLMDALKKAELAKRQGADASADDGGLSLEPLAAPTVPEGEAPPANSDQRIEPTLSLASHLEELDARFLEEAAAAARHVPPPTPIAVARVEPPPAPVTTSFAAEPELRTVPPAPAPEPVRRPVAEPAGDAQVKAAAQNLFAAKQPEKQESRKGFAIAIGVLTVLSVTGIGGYFWWQLQPKNALIARSSPPPPQQPAPASAAPVLAVTAPAPTPAPTAAAPQAAGSSAVPAPTMAKPASPRPAAQTADDDEAPTARTRKGRQARATAISDDVPDDDSPIRITREPLRVDPALNRGYEALNRGELTMAQLEYERARKADPRNTDVLHGLAAIALRQGRYDQAEMLFRQIIESDPQDSVAIAALLNQRGHVDPGSTESRLKSLAATQPDLAAPHFSLGNLYARQGRWNDAQQAYFRAYNAEPDNPDILYNLAISLEHLRQNKLAAQYYAQAVAAAASKPAGFDRAQAAARLKSLQP